MGVLYDVLLQVTPYRDAELLEGYQIYEAVLAKLLTPEQMTTYAQSIQRSGTIRVWEELTSDEIAALQPEEAVIATAIMADENSTMENRRVVALLHQRDEPAVSKDRGLGSTSSEHPTVDTEGEEA